jgi:hypothetical protein
VPVHVSAASQTPIEARQSAPAFPGTLAQNFAPPAPVAHMSTVQGLWSSQSVSALQFGGVMTQSDGLEFGDCDGYEHTSISSPAAPMSLDVKQQLTTASFVRQLLPLHLFPTCVAKPLKGSAPTPMETLHTDVHATGTALTQLVEAVLAQV